MSGLPRDVEELLREHVESIEAVEVLLLLHAQPSREWTGDHAAKELRLDGDSVGVRLDDFVSRGFAVRAGRGVRFSPKDERHVRAIAQLAQCYRTQRSAVIAFIFSKPSDKVQSFADAFRFKKDK